MFLVDTNVLIDVISGNPQWAGWSERVLTEAANRGKLIIGPIVFAEISADFPSAAAVYASLPPPTYALESLPFDAAFVAGKAYQLYRRRGGARTSILSDFLIGGHAIVQGYTLITRDAGVYRSYFPALRLITP